MQTQAASNRQALVSGLLIQALTGLTSPGVAPRLLDCGGGSGTYAVPLAVAGAHVSVVDISADALATLRRRAAEAGVADRVRAVQGDAETITDLVGPDFGPDFDLVLAHGILESVDDVAGAFAAMAQLVRAGGLLSVLVGNPAAVVVARALSGEPVAALRELDDLDRVSARTGPQVVARLCAAAGLVVEARHGVGVFSDLVPGSALDAQAAREALARLDAAAAGRSPFAEIAGRVHLLARRPAS